MSLSSLTKYLNLLRISIFKNHHQIFSPILTQFTFFLLLPLFSTLIFTLIKIKIIKNLTMNLNPALLQSIMASHFRKNTLNKSLTLLSLNQFFKLMKSNRKQPLKNLYKKFKNFFSPNSPSNKFNQTENLNTKINYSLCTLLTHLFFFKATKPHKINTQQKKNLTKKNGFKYSLYFNSESKKMIKPSHSHPIKNNIYNQPNSITTISKSKINIKLLSNFLIKMNAMPLKSLSAKHFYPNHTQIFKIQTSEISNTEEKKISFFSIHIS